MMWRRLALPVYWLALIAATHYPRVPIPGDVPNSDKILHFVAFALLALLFWLFLGARASIWRAALVLIPYSALDEYTQQFVGRDSNFPDWYADVAGIVAMLAVLEIRRRRRL